MAQDESRTCPECDGRIRTVGTERRCDVCGYIAGTDPIDRGPEWRTFDGQQSPKRRTGAPLTRSRHDRGLSSEIGYGTSSRITGRKRTRIHRMRREHNRARVRSKAERNLMNAFHMIQRVTSQLTLPEYVTEQSCALFESAQNENLLQGRSLEGFVVAVIYAVCRTRNLTRTPDEILSYARAERGEFRAAYNALNRDLGLATGPIDPGQYLPRFASKLTLDTAIERQAQEYVRELQAAGVIGGRKPSGIAAGCLYRASQALEVDPLTQQEAAAVANVSPATIRATTDLFEAID